ncbi:MAG: MerC family mercury resistance protein [Candidatus Zixiibacteriota bacterium]
MIKRMLAAIPGVVAALLPNVTCPACWPVYAGVLSSLGLGFLMRGRYFYIVISILLTISLFSLYYKASARRGLVPFLVGCLAAAIILGGKVYSGSDYILYSGAVILIIASIWNNWPIKKTVKLSDGASEPACPRCNLNS